MATMVVGVGGGHLKLRGREERVRCLEIEEGGCGGGSSLRGGGCSGGGFDFGTVDGKLRHRRRQEVVGSGGGFMRIPVGGEKRCGRKKRATIVLDTF
jgi:hypothetical protein